MKNLDICPICGSEKTAGPWTDNWGGGTIYGRAFACGTETYDGVVHANDQGENCKPPIKVVPAGIIEILSGKSPEKFIEDVIRSDKIPEGWKYCEECNSCLVEVGVIYCQRCYESFYSPPKLMMEEIGRLHDLAKQLGVEKKIAQDNYDIISKSNAKDKEELTKLREEVKAWRATANIMLTSFKLNKEHPAYKALESVRNQYNPPKYIKI